MIIVDYSGICLASIIVNKELNEGMVRHMTLNTLRMYYQKFKQDYGEMILACDGMNNWRRDYFPEYKANRKKNREASDFDWNEAFRILNKIREEIAENFPYTVIRVDGCEADDIIGTLVTMNPDHNNDFNPQKNMIVSSDRDFLQLQRFKNTKQFSPILKKEISTDNPRYYLQTHIVRGDKGDGVPNILSDDNVFVEGFRQKPMSKKKVDEIIQDLEDGELLYAASWYRNYCRNKKLIDLSETPSELRREIINNFMADKPDTRWMRRGKVYPYLVANRCNQLIESVQEFI